jgi:hypothetical protein
MEKNMNKRYVDIDDLLDYLLNKSNLDIGDDYYREFFEESLKKCCEEYIALTIPDVQVGQKVWAVTKDYNYELQKVQFFIKECHVIRIQIKKRMSFSVKGDSYYFATFTKNSIGKTIFFTEEDAKQRVEELYK